MKKLLVLCAGLAPALASARAVEFGNISVIQNDAANDATSVTLAAAPGSSPGFSLRGGNRGDYDVAFGSPDDVGAGVMISCVRENGRDNSASGDAFGAFHATSAVAIGGAGYYVPTFRVAAGDEANIDTACAWFPYDQWLGGLARNSAGANGGETDVLAASPGIGLGTHLTSAGGGVFGLDLRALGARSDEGVLLVSHAKNEDNFALSRADADGSFSLFVHDNGANGAAYEQDPVAFVYIPVSAAGTGRLVAAARVNSDGTTDVSGGAFTIQKAGTGTWHLTIPGHDGGTGVLIVSPEGGGSYNVDNVVSSGWDGTNGRWVIESRDLNAAGTTPALQDGATGSEDMFGFAFLAMESGAPSVTLTSPAAGGSVPGPSVTLAAELADPEGDALTATFYGRESTAPGPDFTIVAIPDSQFYTEGSPARAANWGISVEELVGQLSAQTRWVVENRDARNIAFVSHMGDIVQNGNRDGDPVEWIRASDAMGLLENPFTTLRAGGVPYGLAPGNHDMDPIGSYDTGSTAFFNQYFGRSRFDGRPYWGGSYGSDNTNNYQLFSAGGLDFITIHLAYDTTPDQAVLDWADALLKAHPDRRAIVTSHHMIGSGNPAPFSTQGAAIHDSLKDNPNLFLLLGGHIHSEGFRSDTHEGRTVYSILSDYQGLVRGGSAFLRTLTFSPANNRIRVESWSPTLGRAVAASDGMPHFDGAYDLPYDMRTPAGGWTELGTVPLAAGEGAADIEWTGLEAGRDYEWYVAAADSEHATGSAVRRFSVAPAAPPAVTLDAPADGAEYLSPAAITMNATVTGGADAARVEFYQGGVKVGEDDSEPYSFVWTGVQPGVYPVAALVVDGRGNSAGSAVAEVTVLPGDPPPSVELASPAADSVLRTPARIALAAQASDAGGGVVKVEFLSGRWDRTVLGEDAAPPFQLLLDDVAPGTHTFTARATDTAGQTAESAPVTVVVHAEAAPPDAATAVAGVFDAPAWTVVRTGASPRHFNQPGSNEGDLALKINGAAAVFKLGVTLASNWEGPASGAEARDNLCQPYESGGGVVVNVYDNTNDNAADSNPGTSEETAGISAAYLPFAGGWTGACVSSDGTLLASRLPDGVTVAVAATGIYSIDGLSTAGNLLAVTNGNSGADADNVCSVRVEENRWLVDVRDNAGSRQYGPFSFVYLPPDTAGVYACRISRQGTVSSSNASASAAGVTAVPGAGGIDVRFGDGSLIHPESAALFVTGDSSDGGTSSTATDNLISWAANGNSFRIFTQDLEGVNGNHQAIDLRVLAIPFVPAPVESLPEVSIQATDAVAGEHGADTTLGFTLTRVGPTARELAVPLTAAGGAVAGEDYAGFQDRIVIPAGGAAASLVLTVLPDDEAEGAETVTIGIGQDAAFTISGAAQASGTITDKPAQQFYFGEIADAALRGPADDADGDTVANAIEYFMGTRPADAGSRAAVALESAGGAAFTLRYPRARNRPDVAATLLWSTDLVRWHRSGEAAGDGTVHFTETVVSEAGADPEIIEAVGTGSPAAAFPRIYVRLGVE